MNDKKREYLKRKYLNDEDVLRAKYRNVFTHPDAEWVLMDMMITHRVYEMSPIIQGRDPLYCCGFAEAKRHFWDRIRELAGLEDAQLRIFAPHWDDKDTYGR